MNIRFAMIVLSVTAIAAPDVQAQDRPRQHAAFSDSVLKAMIARKPKTKTPLIARIPAMRRYEAKRLSAKSAHRPPASVTAIRKTSQK